MDREKCKKKGGGRMRIWRTEADAYDAILALRKAKKELSQEEYGKLKKKFIEIALRSYTEAQIHFFKHLD